MCWGRKKRNIKEQGDKETHGEGRAGKGYGWKMARLSVDLLLSVIHRSPN